MSADDQSRDGATQLGAGARAPTGTASIGAPEAEARQLIAEGLGDRYDVTRLLGRGGMGDVYLGMHRRIHKPVAIKVLNHQYRHVPEVVERFLQEARSASRVRHPNIVDITDFGDTPQGSVYFVMEYLEGEDLARLIRREGRLTWPRARGLILQLLSALAAAHAQGVIHRDVKPENCLVVRQPDGTELLKVLDFGIAKVMRPDEGGSNMTRTGTVMGTADYMSPEQGQGFPLDARTDIYAVGVILFEMLSGRLPFVGPSALAVLTQHVTAPLPALRVIAPDVDAPPGVEDIVRRATAKTAAERFSSANELADAVRAIGTTGATEISRPTAAVTVEPSRRSPLPWIIGGGALVGVAVTAIVMMKPASTGDDAAGGATGAQPVAAAASSSGAKQPETAPVVKPPTPCPEGMVRVAGATYFMGSTSEHPALKSAHPPHKVDVAPFCLAIHEVTLGEYRKCSSIGQCERAHRDSLWEQGSMDAEAWKKSREAFSKLCNEAATDRDDHPVNCVTWKQADDYCKWAGGRLPTEAEWELAARGTDGRVYPWGDEKPGAKTMNGCGPECTKWREAAGLSAGARMYEEDDGFPGTAPIGSFPGGKTQLGMLDVVGNVFEWTADTMAPYPPADGAAAPAPPEGPKKRVIRGGAFNSTMPEFADPALRFAQEPEAHTHGIGFRCAKNPTGG